MNPNHKPKSSLFSPVVLIVITAVVLVVAVVAIASQQSQQLATRSYTSPTTDPVSEHCHCTCGKDSRPLCAVQPARDETCPFKSYDYEYTKIKDETSCRAKSGTTCQGFLRDRESRVWWPNYGKLRTCEIMAVAEDSTPPPTSTSTPTPS
jgi:hypothetical protein